MNSRGPEGSTGVRSGTFGPTALQCRAVCRDGVELLGIATGDAGARGSSVLFVPGQFDNAYQQPLNQLLFESAAAQSMRVVLSNNRGQDYYSYQRVLDQTEEGGSTWKRFGSSFERVRDRLLDLEAWVGVIQGLGSGDAGGFLVGHSHGAIKVANYLIDCMQANGHVPEFVRGVVLLSPSDDIGGKRKELGSRYDDALAIAREKVSTGEADAYMPDWAYSSPMSCGTYLEAYGEDSPLQTFALNEPSKSPLTAAKNRWNIPTYVVYGENDLATAGLASEDAIEVICSFFGADGELTGGVIAGADHHYVGLEKELVDKVLSWINGVTR